MPEQKILIDPQRLISEVARRHQFILKPDDPAMALITMNQLLLDAAIEAIHQEVCATIAEFQVSLQKVEKRAGRMLAEQVKESAAQWRAGLRGDIHAAGLKASEFVHLVNEAHRRPALLRWGALGIAGSILLIGVGVWLGILLQSHS